MVILYLRDLYTKFTYYFLEDRPPVVTMNHGWRLGRVEASRERYCVGSGAPLCSRLASEKLDSRPIASPPLLSILGSRLTHVERPPADPKARSRPKLRAVLAVLQSLQGRVTGKASRRLVPALRTG